MEAPRLHEFHFGWGYAEGQRICAGPIFYHGEGFENPLEALESFRRVLVDYLRSRKGTDPNLLVLRRMVKDGALSKAALDMYTEVPQEVQPYEVVELFSELWTWSHDDVGARGLDDAFEEQGWGRDWLWPGHCPRPDQAIQFVRTERWLEEGPESSADPEECEPYLEAENLPWVGGYGIRGYSQFPDWSTVKWREWLAKRREKAAEAELEELGV